MRTSFKIVSVILGILMIASGIYCLATPGITFLAVGWIIGFNMIADAIGNIITWKDRKEEGMADGWTLAGAIVSLIFGIVLLGSNAMQLSVDLFVAYMAAIWLIVIGILRLIRSSRLHQFHKTFDTKIIARRWWVVMLNGILLIVLGILSMMNPSITAFAIGTMIGLNVLFAGINLISTACAA
ncbi:MAG: DUF308 domain-containing protein [Clostridia bacterium]|nr:DUF308 domain-containing protein [Clostridia bacterium]